jgi:hypothetical protein
LNCYRHFVLEVPGHFTLSKKLQYRSHFLATSEATGLSLFFFFVVDVTTLGRQTSAEFQTRLEQAASEARHPE